MKDLELNSVKSTIITMDNIEEVSKLLKSQKKELERLTKKKADESVIAAQQQVVNKAKLAVTNLENLEKISNEQIGDNFFTFSVVNEITGKREDQKKKIAFIKNNRPINSKKVDRFIALIADEKYEKAYPIIVIEAKKLIEETYEIKNIKGNILTIEDAVNYFVILDGQHRCTAFAKLLATHKYTGEIPNVYTRDVENIGDYLVEINNTGSSWDKKDRLIVASLTTKEELFKSVASLLNEGFNPSTAMLIYTGKSLSEKQVSKVLRGSEITLPKNAKVNIERGDKFITLCKAAKIDISFITKRYFIKGFNSYVKATSEEQAFRALDNLKKLNLNDEMLKEIKADDSFIEILKNASKE